ncbi:hypothetical protein SNE40_007274 [Patella caerulea]|uniref:Uncharacterized protein n=1 Tax=Patella caerulea TaxID=87958 RepID=A0AAN8JZE6_PATCE
MESFESADTVPKRLRYWAKQQPGREAIVFVSRNKPRASLTSREIYDLSMKFGNHLARIGFKPGRVACSFIPDSPEGLVAFFGIICAGGIVQNSTIHVADGTYLLQNLHKSKCQAIILSSDPDNQANQILSRHFDSVSGNRVISSKLPHLEYVIYTGPNTLPGDLGFVWQDEVESSERVEELSMKADDGVVIVISSGTTGISKLILYSHRNLKYLGDMIFSDINEPEISLLDPHPFNWAWGLPVWYLKTGCKRISLDHSNIPKDAEYFLFLRDIIMQEKCRAAKLSAAAALRLMHINQTDSITYPEWPLEFVYVSGQPLKKNVLSIIGTFTKTVNNTYGMSEIGVVSAKIITKDSGFEDFDAGFVKKGVAVKIVDDNMDEVHTREYGHILVKSPSVFKEYVGEEDKTRSAFTDDGWFLTNDYGCLTENGEIIVQGRFDDVIMRGENYFHPSWIENIIRGCSGVADVLVVKVPDEELFNEICACFLPKPNSNITPDTVKEFCKKQFVNHNSNDKTACPKYYLMFDSFPLNRNGKTDKKAAEQKAAKMLQLI